MNVMEYKVMANQLLSFVEVSLVLNIIVNTVGQPITPSLVVKTIDQCLRTSLIVTSSLNKLSELTLLTSLYKFPMIILTYTCCSIITL